MQFRGTSMKIHLSPFIRRILIIVLIASFMVGSSNPINVQGIRTANPNPIENLRSPAQRTQAEILAAAPGTMEISATGIQPELLQVSVGQAVTFKNSDTVTRRLHLVFQPV